MEKIIISIVLLYIVYMETTQDVVILSPLAIVCSSSYLFIRLCVFMSKPSNYHCDSCNRTFLYDKDYKKHLETKVHRKNLHTE